MNNERRFQVAHLHVHADEFIAAVHGSNDATATVETGLPLAVSQDIRSFESLQRAMNILEKLVRDRADAIEERRAEINDVLEHLRVVH
jgi:hypothetical protein